MQNEKALRSQKRDLKKSNCKSKKDKGGILDLIFKKEPKRYTVEDTIPYLRLLKSGICQLDEKHFSKSITFQDINYQLALDEDRDLLKKMAVAEEYSVDSRNLITKLETFREEISALNHLMEVDEIWKQTGEHQTRIKRVEQECRTNTDKLSGIFHLDDVDDMWNNVEEHTSKLIKCEKRDEELADAIQKNKEEVNENIAEAVRTANAAIKTLTKKVKYAYWIAGETAGLAIIELILLLM
jgi:hypothetical protein